jgi:hypothetical protein
LQDDPSITKEEVLELNLKDAKDIKLFRL